MIPVANTVHCIKTMMIHPVHTPITDLTVLRRFSGYQLKL